MQKRGGRGGRRGRRRGRQLHRVARLIIGLVVLKNLTEQTVNPVLHSFRHLLRRIQIATQIFGDDNRGCTTIHSSQKLIQFVRFLKDGDCTSRDQTVREDLSIGDLCLDLGVNRGCWTYRNLVERCVLGRRGGEKEGNGGCVEQTPEFHGDNCGLMKLCRSETAKSLTLDGRRHEGAQHAIHNHSFSNVNEKGGFRGHEVEGAIQAVYEVRLIGI